MTCCTSLANFGDQRLPERFWSKCIPEPNSGCWLWIGNASSDGYGQFSVGASGMFRAHRFAYEHIVGKIEHGLVTDHLCRTTLCVNPAHLEPVTNAENLRRGESPSAKNARRTHCVSGHEFTPENTRVTNGHRSCVACGNRRAAVVTARTLARRIDAGLCVRCGGRRDCALQSCAPCREKRAAAKRISRSLRRLQP